MVELKEIDTTKLDAAIDELRTTMLRMLIDQRIADLEKQVEIMRNSMEEVAYAAGERGPEEDPNEPDDYESKSHGY